VIGFLNLYLARVGFSARAVFTSGLAEFMWRGVELARELASLHRSACPALIVA
jgi:hypothetical protein